jgi:cobalt-zinc-cadmium efflux system outer membrane protein
MTIRELRRVALMLALSWAGCQYPVREHVDQKVCELAARPRDLAPDSYEATRTPPGKADTGVKPAALKTTDVHATEAIEQAAYADEKMPNEGALEKGLKALPDLPGGNVPKIELPEFKPENLAKRQEIIDKLYPQLRPIGADPQPGPGPEGRPLTLADLQRLALANSPLIVQAVSNISAARGAAIQAGLPPNPSFTFENDGAGTNGTAGLQGYAIEQVVKLGNKLQLQRAVATMDLHNAEVALRRAEYDLSYQVRGGYFAVLVARENMRVSATLSKFASDIYDVQIDQVRRGIAAGYEPAQLRVLAVQARANLVQARNRYVSAWKQLAASLGLPGMPPTELAGRFDIPIPQYDHERVLARALEQHTDVITARNTRLKDVFALKLAKITPLPDVTVHLGLNVDQSAINQPYNMILALSIPIPIWDRNQGGIIQAEGNLINADEEEHRVRDALTTTLADAFERYDNNRILLEYYRDQILPDQVRAYRGVYTRYLGEGGGKIGNPPTLGDVVSAQQTLAGTMQGYIGTLSSLWQAVVDVANVAQTDDLFQINGEPQPTLPVCKLPELHDLPPLPCQHPCSPLGDPALRGMDGRWPPPMPADKKEE